MKIPWQLIHKNLLDHWVRSLLTISAVAVAVFLLLFLMSVITTLDSAVADSASNRLFTQSSVSLFVDLPLNYQEKIRNVPGVERVSKLQWFGGYYKETENFFAQFAVDQDVYFDIHRSDVEIVEAPGVTGNPQDARAAALEMLNNERRGAIIGIGLKNSFEREWKIGDTMPLQASIFSKSDGSAWEFVICGFYRPLKGNVDPRTMYFRWDYFEETCKAEADEIFQDVRCGVFLSELSRGQDPDPVITAIDGLFENGPQTTRTFTEAAFQAGFVSMMGNLPTFLGTIGGAVLFAVLFSVINTMLMSARQRTHEVGIMKALGFRDSALAILLLGESLLIAGIGGGLGVAASLPFAEMFRSTLGYMIPNYAVEHETMLLGFAMAMVIGVLAGIAPAWSVHRSEPVAALRSEG